MSSHFPRTWPTVFRECPGWPFLEKPFALKELRSVI
jgi:hypothetical protein